jgi:hypothetical protein
MDAWKKQFFFGDNLEILRGNSTAVEKYKALTL